MPETASFEHYEILTRDDGAPFELGRGAMGVTFKAFDTRLRMPVALKVINPAYLDSDSARQRFVREAQAAASLRHRNVAAVYHLGTGGDTWFYAMEFIDGETVDALVRRHGPLEPVRALPIAAQVARALNAAMPHGLVHRDIKPANLMLVREDEEVLVKVIDFGLAKSAAIGSDDGEPPGGFVGTPHFASPEQLRGEKVDMRSDLYSLGATLWFMLAGKPPFAGSIEEVRRQHLAKAPPWEQLAPLPEPVLALLRKALEKDPAQRHQTPQEFRRAAEEALAQLPEASMPLDDTAGQAAATADQASDSLFGLETVVADRYRIVERLGETNAGRLYRCYDREAQRDVRLLLLHSDLVADGSAYTQLEREVEKISKVQSPHLLAVQELAALPAASFLVLEWTCGFSLLEVLRVRQELSAGETLLLLKQAAAGAEEALAQGLGRVDFALHQILIHFPQPVDAERLLRTPVGEWPPFFLKLNPLGITRELSASETWAGGQTVVREAASGAAAGDAAVRYVQALGALAYELLGGVLAPLQLASSSAMPGSSHYTPLSTLSEQGNEVLRCALDPARGYPSPKEFYAALERLEVLENKRPETIAPQFATAASVAAETAAAASAHTVRKPPRVPVKFLGGLAAAAALVGGLYLMGPHQSEKQAGESGEKVSESASVNEAPPPDSAPVPPAASLPPASEALPADKPAPAPPSPEQAARVARAEQLQAAQAEADRVERSGDPVAGLQAWLHVAREFPEAEAPRRRLDFVIDPLRKRAELRKPQMFAQLKPLLVEAAQLDAVSAILFLAEAERDVNLQESFAWYSAAAAKGQVEAYLPMGLILSNGVGHEPDLEKAFYYFSLAAEANDTDAKAALAECYLLGKGVPQDAAVGLKWLREAADQGNLRAMNRLADSCMHGRFNLPVNYDEAFRLWSKVAESGDPAPQHRQPIGEAKGNLGVLYMNGQGVVRDEARATSLFQAGAKLGDSNSTFLLGLCLLDGRGGLPKNIAQAQSQIRKAASLGHKGAQKWCGEHGLNIAQP